MTLNSNWDSDEELNFELNENFEMNEHFETEDDIIHDHWFTPGILLFKIPELNESKPTSEYGIAQEICEKIQNLVELEKPERDILDNLYKKLKEQRESEKGVPKSKDGAKSPQVKNLQEQIKAHRKNNFQPLAKDRRHYQRELVAYEKYMAWSNHWPDNPTDSKQIHEMTANERKVVEYYAKLMPRTGKKGQNKKISAGRRILKHINSKTFETMVDFGKFEDTTIKHLVQNIRFTFQSLLVQLKDKPTDENGKKEYRKQTRKTVVVPLY